MDYTKQLQYYADLTEELKSYKNFRFLEDSIRAADPRLLMYVLNKDADEKLRKCKMDALNNKGQKHEIEWKDVVLVTHTVLGKPIFEDTNPRWFDAGSLFLWLSFVRTMIEDEYRRGMRNYGRSEKMPPCLRPKDLFGEDCPIRLETDRYYNCVDSFTYLMFGQTILKQFFEENRTGFFTPIEEEALVEAKEDHKACETEAWKSLKEALSLYQKCTRDREIEKLEPYLPDDKLQIPYPHAEKVKTRDQIVAIMSRHLDKIMGKLRRGIGKK